jgi:hypothetical protein
MPYPKKQAVAVFMDIKRRQGLEAAKAFGRKHRDDLSKGAKAHGQRPYKARKRSK